MVFHLNFLVGETAVMFSDYFVWHVYVYFQALFSIVASVLHLGNVRFMSNEDSDQAVVVNKDTVTTISDVSWFESQFCYFLVWLLC